MSEPTISDYLDMPVRITTNAIYIGDHKMPGVIAEGGITIRPSTEHDMPTMTVEYIIGGQVTIEPGVYAHDNDGEIQYGTRPPAHDDGST